LEVDHQEEDEGKSKQRRGSGGRDEDQSLKLLPKYRDYDQIPLKLVRKSKG